MTWCKLEKIKNLIMTYSQPLCFSRHMATPTMRLVPGAGVMWSEMLRGVGRFALLDILIDSDRCCMEIHDSYCNEITSPSQEFLCFNRYERVYNCSQRPF